MRLAPFVEDAERAAARTQRGFLRIHLVQLGLLLIAAIVALTSWQTDSPPVDWSGLVAATLLGVGLLLRVMMLQRKDEDSWYSARHAAEVSKSLCFQYSFGAAGYELSEDARTVDARFIDAFATLGRDVLLTDSGTRTDAYSEITDDMRAARAMPFVEARTAYFTTRIEDQERWYAARSAFHLRRSRLWLSLMLVAQVAGMFFAILKAIPELGGPFGGLVGLASALAAAFLAWSQLRQHSMLARSYRNQSVQLRDFGRRLALVEEAEWPAFVASVESSLIAEHTHWQGLQGFGR